MEKINIAKLLKDCPRGMELNCTMYNNLYFNQIYDDCIYKIGCYTIVDGIRTSVNFTEFGTFNTHANSKCVIFPKGKITWKGFVPPCQFKNGDVVATTSGTWIGITTGGESGESIPAYCVIKGNGEFEAYTDVKDTWCFSRLATKEERQKLFDEIKAHGYIWNSETKTLEKITQPKFKVGDWITDGVSKCQIHFIDDTQYWYSENCILGSIESVDKRYHLWTINDAKDGDILFHSDSASNGIFIFKEILQYGTIEKVVCHCDYDSEDGFCLGENHTCCWTDSKILYPATKERCDILFQKMKEAGYKWNVETKTLEKLIEPKFKVGDRIVEKNGITKPFTISQVGDGYYYVNEKNAVGIMRIEDQDKYELVPNKFDITTLKPFDKVLVRCHTLEKWHIQFFEKYDKTYQCPFICIGRTSYKQCIPYEHNEHLLDTANDCQEFYKNWE